MNRRKTPVGDLGRMRCMRRFLLKLRKLRKFLKVLKVFKVIKSLLEVKIMMFQWFPLNLL